MLPSTAKKLSNLRDNLHGQRYSPTVVNNYCLYAGQFLTWLEIQSIHLCDVTQDIVVRFLNEWAQQFEKDRGRKPASRWSSVPRAGIHVLLRSELTEWPPTPPAASAAEQRCLDVCNAYELWLKEERGLAKPSIRALMWEARHFCKWLIQRLGENEFANLNVRHIDAYMDSRAPGLTRKSLKDVAERLRGFLRYLHRNDQHAEDLSRYVIAPLLYAYEGIPSILTTKQIEAVLGAAAQDTSSCWMSLRTDPATIKIVTEN